ncbi:unnamed protein product [Dovyalis caffra]|uniref:Uncharacterized protein n=1 Tax=Dovyalis caffra TaxID=77055 RepID=A0AAV1S9H0_9ROSI|nr:unnamed protein product [Dovyalis caffra]
MAERINSEFSKILRIHLKQLMKNSIHRQHGTARLLQGGLELASRIKTPTKLRRQATDKQSERHKA